MLVDRTLLGTSYHFEKNTMFVFNLAARVIHMDDPCVHFDSKDHPYAQTLCPY
jgi:hypothetical protein